jgi:hypothetical protein
MSELHENELGYFVDSLSQHQRVYLQRLIGEFLTSFPAEGEEIHPDWLALHRQSAQTLFSLIELMRKFQNDDSDSDIRPYALTMPEPGHAKILLAKRFLHWRGLWDAKSHEWVKEVKLGRLTVDLRSLDEITSSAIAWLVNLANHAPHRRIFVVGACPIIRRSLVVLRLNDVLVMTDD